MQWDGCGRRVVGWRQSQLEEKKNLKCIWHSDELHLPHHPVGSKASPMSTGAQIVVQKSLRLSPSNLTFCLRECFPDEVIIMSQHETIYFKKSDTEGNLRLCTLPIWNLNLFDMGFHHGLIFSCSFIFFSLSTPKLRQRTRRSLLCSSDSLWRSVGGLQTNRKWRNMPKKMARLFPKCHVSLNKSQRWFSLRWLLIAAKEKHSPAVNLHFNMPPTSSMLLLLRIY